MEYRLNRLEYEISRILEDIIDALKDFMLFMLVTILVTAVILITIKITLRFTKRRVKIAKADSAQGIIFGKFFADYVYYSPYQEEAHCLVVGGSGLGKTSCLLIPLLRSLPEEGCGSLTVDIAGDISSNVSKSNKIIFNPIAEDSAVYDVFAYIDGMDSEAQQDQALEQLAYLLAPEDPTENSNSKYFNSQGRKILIASLIAFYHKGYDFIDICKLIVGSNWRKLFMEIDLTENRNAALRLTTFDPNQEKTIALCKESCDSYVYLFATNEVVQRNIGRASRRENAVSFSPAKLEYNHVFLVVDEELLDVYAPLLKIITAQCLEFFSRRKNLQGNTIFFCLDELASLGNIDIIGGLRRYRKKRVRIIACTQSIGDLDLLYGTKQRISMIDNFSYKVVLGVEDPDAQEYFSRIIGEKQGKQKSRTFNLGLGKTSKTLTDTRERIIPAHKLKNLGNKLILIHSAGHLKIRKKPYYK